MDFTYREKLLIWIFFSKFSEDIDFKTITTQYSDDILILPGNGSHHFSSKLHYNAIPTLPSLENEDYQWGNLVAAHFSGQ